MTNGKQVIEDIVTGIETVPWAFFNIALTGEGSLLEVYGPRPITSERPYGYTDELISRAESGDYKTILNGRNTDLCGEIFNMGESSLYGYGMKPVPFMMRLARAGIIVPTSYSEGRNLDLWKINPEVTPEIHSILRAAKDMHRSTDRDASEIIKGGIRKLLSPDSPIPEGRTLYQRIIENYK